MQEIAQKRNTNRVRARARAPGRKRAPEGYGECIQNALNKVSRTSGDPGAF